MRCLHPDKPCPFRERVCRGGECWWNCGWSCEHAIIPVGMSDCYVVQQLGFCPHLCIYEALEGECPFKDELSRLIESGGR